MMNWILLVMATIAAVMVAMLLGGAMAPRTRRSVRSLHAARHVHDGYACVREADGPPRWCADLPTMHVADVQAPDRITVTLIDDDGAAMGQWDVTVAAVRGGLISLEEACRRYTLSTEEFISWQRAIEQHGLPGLRATRLQDYRDPSDEPEVKAQRY